MSDIDDNRDEMIRNCQEIQRLQIEDRNSGNLLKDRWTSCMDRWMKSGPHAPSEEMLIQERLRSMTSEIDEVTRCHEQLQMGLRRLIDDASHKSEKVEEDHGDYDNLLSETRRLLAEVFPKLNGVRDRQVQAVDQLQSAVESMI